MSTTNSVGGGVQQQHFPMINLTPHAIVVVNQQSGVETCFEPSGRVARVTERWPEKFESDPDEPETVPIISAPIYTGIEMDDGSELPVLKRLIVSLLVAQYMVAHANQFALITAVYTPDTGPTGVIRDAAGRITGTRRLIRHLPISVNKK